MSVEKHYLNGAWKLAYVENSKVFDCTTVDLIAAKGYPTVDAVVPGNFETDLERAGHMDDPFYSTNIYGLQKLECMHMFYYRTFSVTDPAPDRITFEGLDTFADVYINGVHIGHGENMLISHTFKLPELKDKNEIVVHILPATIEARKKPVPVSSNALKYCYDSLYVRKAASMYGWDIMPRAVSGGIWRDVYLFKEKEERIDDVFAYTLSADRQQACLQVHYDLTITGDHIKDYRFALEGCCEDSRFCREEQLWFTSGKMTFTLPEPKLWFPQNYGKPHLYRTSFKLYKGEELLDEKVINLGIRTVRLDRTSVTDEEGRGEFRIVINNRPVFAMGSNWVPVDAMHSRDRERLPLIMPMLKDLGCNIVRCWGGNVYEHSDFYDYCDQNGIMIWQDFAMACGVYPQEEEFLDMLRPEVISVIKKYRNHPSLVLWAGDNECDYGFTLWGGHSRNPDNNIITRRLIKDLVNAHDFTRPYLPSSPYIDSEAFNTGKPTSEDHLWGPRDYFKGDFYKNTVCHFASETGYHGCPDPESLKKFISPEKLWPWRDPKTGKVNSDWLAHSSMMEEDTEGPFSYRIGLAASQVVTLFGKEPDTLEEFALASQISQGEAMKYFIERFRSSKWRRTGIIWWNLIDGWPQISDAVVDYYLVRKLGYYYIKASQQQLCMMMDQREKELMLYVANDIGEDIELEYKVTDITSGKVIFNGIVSVEGHSSALVATADKNEDHQHFYIIEWKDKGQGEFILRNHFMSDIINIDIEQYKENMRIYTQSPYSVIPSEKFRKR